MIVTDRGLAVSDGTLWWIAHNEHPTLGRIPDTLDIARLLGVPEASVTNRLVVIREDRHRARWTRDTEWEATKP